MAIVEPTTACCVVLFSFPQVYPILFPHSSSSLDLMGTFRKVVFTSSLWRANTDYSFLSLNFSPHVAYPINVYANRSRHSQICLLCTPLHISHLLNFLNEVTHSPGLAVCLGPASLLSQLLPDNTHT